jgi:hypothetical protein
VSATSDSSASLPSIRFAQLSARRRHIAASFAATPSILPARRTRVLPPEGPELRGDSARTSTRLVPCYSDSRVVVDVLNSTTALMADPFKW